MYYGINYKSIIKVIGILLCIEALFMLIPLTVSIVYRESDLFPFLQTFIITGLCGAAMIYLPKESSGRIRKRDGFLTVALCWIFISLMGALPFFLNGDTATFTDAFFEAMSGFTTTGMTVLENIDTTTHGILLWRSLSQWMGGMGIILFTLAVLPILNSGSGIQLFGAEVTGIRHDKLEPRISQTSKKLWGLYLILTLILIILLCFGPMSVFDAVCTALSTTATGGFSTKQDSILYWNSAYVDYVVMSFMFISGINFALVYRSVFRGYKNLLRDEELKWYFIIVLIATILLAGGLMLKNIGGNNTEEVVRNSLFTVISAITSTGFSIANFCNWGTFFFIIICICMFLGGCAGSTAGGTKIVRAVVLFKNMANEFYRQIHPNSVRPVRLNGNVLSYDVVSKVGIFLSLYTIIIIGSSIILSATGLNFDESFGLSISAIGNCGFGFVDMNPDKTLLSISDIGKWTLIFDMLVGRLEIFTVLILFSPYLWEK